MDGLRPLTNYLTKLHFPSRLDGSGFSWNAEEALNFNNAEAEFMFKSAQCGTFRKRGIQLETCGMWMRNRETMWYAERGTMLMFIFCNIFSQIRAGRNFLFMKRGRRNMIKNAKAELMFEVRNSQNNAEFDWKHPGRGCGTQKPWSAEHH